MSNLTNCKNCGAPLHNGKCEYCGSEYEWIQEINDFRQIIKLYIGGKIRSFYIREITCEPIYFDACRYLDGTMTYVDRGMEQFEINLISYD